MKKSFLIIILALVMVTTFALALTNTQTASAATPTFPSVDEPLHALVTSDYYSVDNVTNDAADFTHSNGSFTANSGSGWSVLKIVINNTGTFSWTSNMTTYNGGWKLDVNSTGTYYYKLVPGVPATDLTYSQIQSVGTDEIGKPFTEGTGNKSHSVAITQALLVDGKATLYLAFNSVKTTTNLGRTGNDSLTISGATFTYVQPEMSTITFSTAEDFGSISASWTGGSLTNGGEVDKGATVTFTANPGNGQFYYWKYADGTFISASNTISITADEDKNVVAEIRQKDYYKVYIGNSYYQSLESLVSAGHTSGTAVVIPTEEGTTVTGNVTIPASMTLLVPYTNYLNASQTSADGRALGEGESHRPTWVIDRETGTYDYRYSHLIINAGASLTINGRLVVGAVYGIATSGANAQGQISGNYGEIENNGTITVNGTADLFGLISGNGQYLAKSGSASTLTMVFVDFVGGSNLRDFHEQGVYPFSHYCVQNILCTQTIEYGAKVFTRASIYAGDQFNKKDIAMITPSGTEGFFLMDSGSTMIITYDQSRHLDYNYGSYTMRDYGQMTISITGNVTMASLTLTISLAGGDGFIGGILGSLSSVTVKSSDYVFGIPYGIHLNIENGGNLTVPSGLQFAVLPGSQVHVKQGGVVNLDGSLYVMDGLAITDKSAARYPSAHELITCGRDANGVQPYSAGGNLIVDGTLNLNSTSTFAGIAQTTQNTGAINVAHGAKLGGDLKWGGKKENGAGNDTIVNMTISARVGRNSVLQNGLPTVSNGNNFVDLTAPTTVGTTKTYKALTNVAGNTIQTILPTANLTQKVNNIELMDPALNGGRVTVNDKAVTVQVDNVIKGTFYEWDSTNEKYIVPVQLYVGQSTLTSANVNVQGVGSLYTNADGYLLQNDTTTVLVPMTENGQFGYHTLIDGTRVGPQADEVAQFAGVETITLTKVIKGAELNANTTIIRNFNKDGSYTDNNLQGRLVYYGTDNYGDFVDLTGAQNNLSATDISGEFTYSLLGVEISDTVYQYTQAMAEYTDAHSKLLQADANSMLQQATTLASNWDALVSGKTTSEQNFINSHLGHLNSYFGIYKAFEFAQGQKAYYGDTTVTLTAVPIKGNKVENVTVNVGNFAYDNTTGLTATLSYEGTFAHEQTSYAYNVSMQDAQAFGKQITVVVNDVTGHIYGDANGQDLDYWLKEDSTLVGTDSLDQIISVSCANQTASGKSYPSAGDYNITATKTGTKAGFYNVTFVYTQSGHSVYSIAKKSITVALAGTLTFEYGEHIPTEFSFTEQSQVPNDANLTITLDPKAYSDGNVGTYSFVISDRDGNYAVSHTSILTIVPRTLEVSIGNTTVTYGQVIDVASCVTLKNALESDKQDILNSAIISINGVNATTIVPQVGTYALTVTVEADDYYTIVYGDSATLTVVQRTIRVAIDNKTSVYGDDIAKLTAQLVTGSTLVAGHTLYEGENAVISLSKEQGDTVQEGGYAVIGTVVNNNYNVVFTNGKYTITPRPLTVQISTELTKVYDGKAPNSDTFTYTVTGLVGGGTSTTLPEGTLVYTVANSSANVGEYTIKGALTGATNYTCTVVDGLYTINKLAITVTIANKQSIYGDALAELTSSVTSVNQIVEGDTNVYTLSTTATPTSDFGSYNIGGTSSNGNYIVTFESGVYTINRRPITVTIADKSSVYGNAFATLTATATGTLVSGHSLYGGANTVIELVKAPGTNAGTYKITVDVLNANYAVTVVGSNQNDYGTYTIEKRPLTVSLGMASSIYGDEIKSSAELYKVANVTGYIDADKDLQLFQLSVRDTNGLFAKQTSSVGFYNIQIEAGSVNKNYKITNQVNGQGLYSITKRDVTITLGSAERIYNGQEITLDDLSAILVTLDNHVASDETMLINLVKSKLFATENSTNVGNYAVESTFVAHSNYNVSYDNKGVFVITARPITIEIATNGTSQYGNAIDLLSLVNVTGENSLVDDANKVFSLALQAPNKGVKALKALASTKAVSDHNTVGTYNIVCQNVNANYLLVKVNGQDAQQTNVVENAYQITKREIAIAIGNGQKVYDGLAISDTERDQIKDISWFGGLIGTEDDLTKAELLNALTLAVQNNGKDVAEGGYTVSGSFAHANYTATITDGVFTITPKAITITVGNGTKVYDGQGISTLGNDVTIAIPDAVANDLTALVDLVKSKFVAISQTDVSLDGYNITFEQITHPNYTIDCIAGKYTITPRPLTVQISTELTKAYDGLQANVATFTYSVTDNAGVYTYNTLPQGQISYTVVNSSANVGEYIITGSVEGATNYTFTVNNGKYTITPRDISITIDQIKDVRESSQLYVPVTSTMDWNNNSLVFEKAVYAIKSGAEIVAYINNGVVDNAIPFGEYTVVLFSYDDENFNIINFGSQTLNVLVTKDSYIVTITFDEITGKQYDGNAVEPSIIVTEKISGDAVDNFTYTVTKGLTVIENKVIKDVGQYFVHVYVDNEEYGAQEFSITKREIAIAIGNGQKVYDGLAISDTERDQIKDISWFGGLIGTEDDLTKAELLNALTLAVQNNGKDVAEGGYTVSGSFAHANYTATITDGVFTITPKAITITVGNGTKVYDGQGISTLGNDVTIAIPDAVANDLTALVDLVKSKFVAISQTDVSLDGYNITFEQITHPNYTIDCIAGKYTITPRPLTVQISTELTKAYDGLQANVATFTYSVTDNAGVYTYNTLPQGQISYTVVNSSANVGEYIITGSVEGATNYTFTVNNGKYTITPRPITIEIATNGTSQYGEAMDLLSLVSVTGANQLVDNKDDVLSVALQTAQPKDRKASAFAQSILGAGTYNIVCSNINSNYNIETINNVAVTNQSAHIVENAYVVAKRQITLAIGNAGNRDYNGEALAASELSKANFVWNNLIGEEDLADYVTLTVSSDAKDAGTHTISGTFAHTNYEATITPGTFTINKLEISIDFENCTKVYDGQGILTWDNNVIIVGLEQAVANDRLELRNLVISKFEPINSSDASATGYDITFGDLTHKNYIVNIAEHKYTITPKDISFEIGTGTKVYDGTAPTLDSAISVTLQGAVKADESSLVEAIRKAFVAIADVNVGVYQIASTFEGNNNYNVTGYTKGEFTITARPISVTVDNKQSTYGDALECLTVTIVEGEMVGSHSIYDYITLAKASGTTVKYQEGTVVGYDITATDKNALDNYAVTIQNVGKYTINPRKLTVTLGNASTTYGDEVLSSAELYALAKVENVVSADFGKQLFELKATATSASNVDLYNILLVENSVDSNYVIETINSDEKLYVITARLVTVTIGNVQNHIYGETFDVEKLSASVTIGNLVNGDKLGDVVALSTLVDSTTSVGAYPIVGKGTNNNYDVTIVEGTFEVVARPVTVVIGNQTSTYGDQKVTPTATVSATDAYGFVNGDNLYDFVTLTNPSQTNVGVYDIVGQDKSAEDNYHVTITSGKYTIVARQIYVELGTISKVYDKQPNDLSGVSIKVWYQDGNKVVDLTEQLKDNVQLSSVRNVNVGSHAIQGEFVGNDNYVVAQGGWATGTLNITARPITVTIDDATSIYGDALAELTWSVTSVNQIVEGDTNVFSLSCSVTNTSYVGNYDIVGQKGTNTNYDVTFVNGNYQVTKRSIDIKVENATSEYASNFVLPKLTFANGTSLASTDTLSQVVKAVWEMKDEVSTYEISAELIDNINYQLVNIQTGTYTVTPIALTVSINPIKVFYGDAILTQTELAEFATVSGNIAPADQGKQLFTFKALANEQSIVGNYDIEGTAHNKNYNIKFENISGKYQIAKRPVTLLINNATSVYASDFAPLTVNVSMGNLVFGDKASDLVAITKADGTNVGEYYIKATKVDGALASNYDVSIAYTAGDHSVYTITPRPVEFDIANLSMYNTDSWEKLAQMFAGQVREDIGADDLQVTYKVLVDKAENLFLTEENFAKEIRVGNFEIHATSANANYNVTFNVGTLSVTLPKVAVGEICQNYTFNPQGLSVFNWQTQIADYIPSLATESTFNAKLMQGDDVILSGSVIEGVVPAGEYTLVIEIVHTGKFNWQDGAVTEYAISVAKMDISNTIVSLGFQNGGWLTNSASGVSAMVQDNFDIYVDTVLSMDGVAMSDLSQCGNYTMIATIDDADYCGQATFSFRVIQDIAPTMANLNTMLNDYSREQDFATRLSKLTQMVEFVATLNTQDAELQINNNIIYKQLIQKVSTNWTEYVEDCKQDVEVANSVWQNVVLQVATTISLLVAVAFVTKRSFGL